MIEWNKQATRFAHPVLGKGVAHRSKGKRFEVVRYFIGASPPWMAVAAGQGVVSRHYKASAAKRALEKMERN